jgi:hypothetical protein
VKPGRLIAALAAFAVPAAVYVASASPEPGAWDTAELQGVPYILGISHPTGFPFYVLTGYAWSHVIALGSIAWRMNVMSGFAMGAACVAAYGTALEFGASLVVALSATLAFAFTQDVWAHASRAEAQDLAVACAALAILAFVRWMRGGAAIWFAAAFALAGLGMAAHPNALWILPAFILGAELARRRPPLRLVAVSAALAVAALSLYLYLPLRSQYVATHALDPAAVLPGAGGGIFWNYNDPRTVHGLARELTGSEFQTPRYLLASFNPLHVAGALGAFVGGLNEQYGTIAMLLILVGLFAAARRDWRSTLVVVAACTTGLVFSVIYPNESDIGRYRMLASWVAVPLLGALTPHSKQLPATIWQVALVLFLTFVAGSSLERHRNYFHHAPAEGGRWVIRAVRPWVPSGSVIVTSWLDATSLAYGAYADGSLSGRIIVSDDKLDIARYRVWARNRRVFVLVNPHDTGGLGGASDYAKLDDWHELYEVER